MELLYLVPYILEILVTFFIANAVCKSLKNLVKIVRPSDRWWPWPPEKGSLSPTPILWTIFRCSLFPDPVLGGCCENFVEHFQKPFLETLPVFGIELETYSGFKMYQEGIYNDYIRKSLDETPRIMKIFNRYREHLLQPDWLPQSHMQWMWKGEHHHCLWLSGWHCILPVPVWPWR